ncbi:hypothetical protein AVEN_108337-1 [Araneus ventricosus]|uniref:Uncharacterized protein n=1 Tax=Araneus ventricosus TaxID=182803 RepID=A0A4Y2Q3Q0_ARAVE|nr:hypothetical protein AVEN_3129-1 [Araneus ventricosus]GBN57510.1 hypothetical protein AVEN_103656-1 [Araneus ventricosus]GBN57594.1 hypothetical protein AVEN_27346-1 [Araneus ventricosus]GBN57694.1 hypothetical protein AVEN_108337-1 [Araneus ventricosus]
MQRSQACTDKSLIVSEHAVANATYDRCWSHCGSEVMKRTGPYVTANTCRKVTFGMNAFSKNIQKPFPSSCVAVGMGRANDLPKYQPKLMLKCCAPYCLLVPGFSNAHRCQLCSMTI